MSSFAGVWHWGAQAWSPCSPLSSSHITTRSQTLLYSVEQGGSFALQDRPVWTSLLSLPVANHHPYPRRLSGVKESRCSLSSRKVRGLVRRLGETPAPSTGTSGCRSWGNGNAAPMEARAEGRRRVRGCTSRGRWAGSSTAGKASEQPGAEPMGFAVPRAGDGAGCGVRR